MREPYGTTGRWISNTRRAAQPERGRAPRSCALAKVGISELAHHLKFEVCYAPQTWAGLYNLTKGSAFGLSHGIWQVGYLRPRNRHSRDRNLYFVGASTQPGGGLPMVLDSARLTCARIQRELGLSAVAACPLRR